LPIALLAMLWAGFLGDKMNLWLAKRRGGVHLPEDTLVVLILPTVVSMIGIVGEARVLHLMVNHHGYVNKKTKSLRKMK
jgi:hypothetical protein